MPNLSMTDVQKSTRVCLPALRSLPARRRSSRFRRRRRFKVSTAVSGLGMIILVAIWAMTEYHNAGDWPVRGFSQSSGIHDVWNFWIVYPVGAWVFLTAAFGWAFTGAGLSGKVRSGARWSAIWPVPLSARAPARHQPGQLAPHRVDGGCVSRATQPAGSAARRFRRVMGEPPRQVDAGARRLRRCSATSVSGQITALHSDDARKETEMNRAVPVSKIAHAERMSADDDLRNSIATGLRRWPSAGAKFQWFATACRSVLLSRRRRRRLWAACREDTVFRIGSLTKTITAVAVMQLCEQGLLDLDAPANDYLRAFHLVPASAGFGPATVSHLLGARLVSATGGGAETCCFTPCGLWRDCPLCRSAPPVLPRRPPRGRGARDEVGIQQPRFRRAWSDRAGSFR